MTSDDGDDDVQCVMIAKNISKEAEIKEALRMMITKPPKADVEGKTKTPNADLEENRILGSDSETSPAKATKPPPKTDLKERSLSGSKWEAPPAKIVVKCQQFGNEAILNLDETKTNTNTHAVVKSGQACIDEKESTIDTMDAMEIEENTKENNSTVEVTCEEEILADPSMEAMSEEESAIVLEAGNDVDLGMSWQLKKWPSLPSLLNRFLMFQTSPSL